MNEEIVKTGQVVLVNGLKEVVVHLVPVSCGEEKALMLSLVPEDINLETLQLNWEEGGLTFRDSRKYGEWEGCRCEIVTQAELLQGREQIHNRLLVEKT